jgi:hypothetical protein
MNQHYDRSAITRRAHAIRRESGCDFGTAMRAAWAEAKSPRAVERCGTRVVAHIDAQQPGGVIAAMARYGIRLAPIIECVAALGERVTEIAQTAAIRRQANVDALKDGARVVDLRRSHDGAYRI